MRPDKDLDAMVAASLEQSKGTCPWTIVARSPEERLALEAKLKGRRGAKLVKVRTEEETW